MESHNDSTTSVSWLEMILPADLNYLASGGCAGQAAGHWLPFRTHARLHRANELPGSHV